jgi:hypothetical protein
LFYTFAMEERAAEERDNLCKNDDDNEDVGVEVKDNDDDQEFNLQGEFHEDDMETSGALHSVASSSPCGMIPSIVVEEVAELEYEYEPGISLSSLEFGSQYQPQPLLFQQQGRPASAATAAYSCMLYENHCFFCGVDYESGKEGRKSDLMSNISKSVKGMAYI